MKVNWIPIGGYGYQISIYDGDNEVAEANVFKTKDDVYVNWLMVIKQYQNQGHGYQLLEIIKDNILDYYPKAKILYFRDVTSLGVLSLIEKVFSSVELHSYSDRLPIDLPSKSPAKYNSDGGSYISKRASKESYKVKL